jgi:GrpB-like predicted nucleotidyltransferase (UPF0157 family)
VKEKVDVQIKIVGYDDSWPQQFLSIANSIEDAVGELAVKIDHIGSTSVPGLAAKDIVDVQVTVSSLENEEFDESMSAARFMLRPTVNHDLLSGLPSDSPELRKKFYREPQGQRRVHIHVREEGRLNQAYPLLFRDYLIAEPAVKEAYQSIKERLAKHFPHDEDAYYDIKDPYMDTVFYAAKLWASREDWKP